MPVFFDLCQQKRFFSIFLIRGYSGLKKLGKIKKTVSR